MYERALDALAFIPPVVPGTADPVLLALGEAHHRAGAHRAALTLTFRQAA